MNRGQLTINTGKNNNIATRNSQNVIFTSHSENMGELFQNQTRSEQQRRYPNRPMKAQMRQTQNQRLDPHLETLPADPAYIFLTTDCVDLEPVPNIVVEPAEQNRSNMMTCVVLKKINEEKESNLQTCRSGSISASVPQSQVKFNYKNESELNSKIQSPERSDSASEMD